MCAWIGVATEITPPKKKNHVKSISQSSKFVACLLGLPFLAQAELTHYPISGGESHEFFFPSTGVAVGEQALLLGIDNYLLPLRENVCLYLSKPTYRKNPVLAPSKENVNAPDQVASHFYGTVLKDNGKYRMWYYPCWSKPAGDPYRPKLADLQQGPVCYAESDDGITWTKPNLGQVEFKGSKNNNAILLSDERIETVSVIKEESDPDPSRRYKMVYNAHNGTTWVIRTATSTDGLNWRFAPKHAIDQFIETASFYKFNGLYVANGQRILPSEGGHAGGRQGNAIVSANFGTWLPGHTDAFLLPEPAKPEDRGMLKPYDQVHLGVGAAPFGNVVVGLYGLWHNKSGDGDPASEQRWKWFGWGKITCDLGLVISNDGLHFREPDKGRVYISHLESPATPLPGQDYPTILTQSGNGIFNDGDETRIYYGRWLNGDYDNGYSGEVALATLPRDRWGGLGLYPEQTPPRRPGVPSRYRNHGSIWSAPVRLPASGCAVVLNADHTSRMTVEVADVNFQLLTGYSGDWSGKSSQKSGLDCAVSWPAGDLAALGGQTVRFKISLKAENGVDPRIYAVYLRSK